MAQQPGFWDFTDRLQELSAHGDPLDKLTATVDFELFRAALTAALGARDLAKGGHPGFDPVLKFRMLVLQTMHGLSLDQTEYLLRDRLSWMRFCGLRADVHPLHQQCHDPRLAPCAPFRTGSSAQNRGGEGHLTIKNMTVDFGRLTETLRPGWINVIVMEIQCSACRVGSFTLKDFPRSGNSFFPRLRFRRSIGLAIAPPGKLTLVKCFAPLIDNLADAFRELVAGDTIKSDVGDGSMASRR